MSRGVQPPDSENRMPGGVGGGGGAQSPSPDPIHVSLGPCGRGAIMAVVRSLPVAFCLLSAVLCLLSPAPAQDAAGSITVQVKDRSGLPVAEVELAATHAATGAVRRAVTGPEGAYVFTALPIGAYQLSALRAGFKKSTRAGIELHVGDHLSIDLALEVGDVVQEVSVTADAPQVQLENSEQSGLISGEQVRELQLNGRSFMTLLELLPGVSSDMPDRVDPNTNPALYINGARNSAANFNIDGGNNSDVIVGSGSLNTFTSVETIAEFKVLTSTFAAEYGRGGFAQVNVVTRGGARNFHGSLFEFVRNDALDARDYFSHQVLPLKYHDFGYTIGGPVALPWYNRDRRRTFFFFAQHFNRLSARGEAVNTTVPAPVERDGDFSGRGPGRDGQFETGDDPVLDPATLAGFPGGIIPRSRMDSNAVKLLPLYPAPNFRGPGAVNFTSAAPSRQNWREEMVRLDHHFSQDWKIYGRWAQDSAFIMNPYGGSSLTAIGTRFPGISATRATRPGKNLTVNLTRIFRQDLLNEFTFTYAGREITQMPVAELATRRSLGIDIPEIFPENDGDVIPTINLGSGFAALNVSRVWLKQLFNLEFSNNVTRIAGRHVWKFGGVYSYGGNRENPTGPNTNGSFTFNTGFSRNPVANMLLGLPFSYSEAERFVVSHARFGMLEAFVQDDVRATPRLTLNLGVRWSNYFNPYDTRDVLTNFLPRAWDPARAPRIDPVTGRAAPGSGDPLNGVILAGKNSPYGRRVTENNTNLVGPRFGFAYDLFGKRKTALRGGYGINYTRPLIGTFINSAFDNTPFARSVTIQEPLFRNPGGGAEAPQNPPTLTALGTPMAAPTIQQWGLGVQQDLGRQTLVGVSYVGSHGVHLFRPLNINSPPPGEAAARGVHLNSLRPYAGWGTITERQPTALSTYHSLQWSLNRRFSKGLGFGIAYTFAKSIDNASSDRGGSDVPPDSRNAHAERGPSDFDRTHVLTGNYIWNLPRLARGRLRSLRLPLNGWQMSGILRFWTGRPFDVVMSQDVAGIGATQNQRPDVIAATPGPRTVEEWFNRSAFARPASGAFGNMGRNSLRGPGVHKWDLSLFKNFAVTEALRAQFRAEFFNAFNHPSFTTVGASLTTTTAGVNPGANSFAVVTGTRDARVVQFGLRVTW